MLNILITGANGQLGSSLRQLGSVSPNNYLATDVAMLDTPTPGAVLQTVKEQRIDVIVNCAAYTNVERARRMNRQPTCSTTRPRHTSRQRPRRRVRR